MSDHLAAVAPAASIPSDALEVHGVGGGASARFRALTLAVATCAAVGGFGHRTQAQTFAPAPQDAAALDAAHVSAIAVVSSPSASTALQSSVGSVTNCVQDGLLTARTTDPGSATAAVCFSPDGNVLGSMLSTVQHGALVMHKVGAFVNHHHEVDQLGKPFPGQPVQGIVSAADISGGSSKPLVAESADQCAAQATTAAAATEAGKITTAVCYRADGHMLGTLVAMAGKDSVTMHGTGVFAQDHATPTVGSGPLAPNHTPFVAKKIPSSSSDLSI